MTNYNKNNRYAIIYHIILPATISLSRPARIQVYKGLGRSGELMVAKLTLILPATTSLSRPARIQVYKGLGRSGELMVAKLSC